MHTETHYCSRRSGSGTLRARVNPPDAAVNDDDGRSKSRLTTQTEKAPETNTNDNAKGKTKDSAGNNARSGIPASTVPPAVK